VARGQRVTAVGTAPRADRAVAWAATTDHKRVGLLTMGAAFAVFLLAGLFAMVVRVELAEPGMQVLSHQGYNEAFTLHGAAMIYLFLTPFALATGVYLVPLQVGSTRIAAPRLALLGFWLLLAAIPLSYVGVVTQQGGGRAGWTAFYPLSDAHFAPGLGMDLWIVGTILATLSSLIHGWCVLWTALRLRAPGMTMLRLPIFTWTQIVTCLMVITAFPVFMTAFALLLLDRHGVGVFARDGGPVAYQHLFWFYAHPVVYVMFFPFVGAVAEVAATFGRRKFFAYRGSVLSLLVFAALSMSVWAHHMFTTARVPNEYFSLTSTLISVPAGAEYFAIVGTLVTGALVFSTPLLFALGFVLLFLIGGLTGVVVASPPLDYHVHDTYFVVAHFHYTLFAGSAFGLFAGIYYWFPKASGVLLREGLGKVHFALFFVGTNLTYFPMFLLGYDGMRRRVADYPESAGYTGLNQLATAGAFVLLLGVAVFLGNVWVSLRRRVPAGDDPWGGQTLEWATSSPPPRRNFDRLPEIRSYAPLYDLREGQRAR
jgi:cytochrome c oxidase subunit I